MHCARLEGVVQGAAAGRGQASQGGGDEKGGGARGRGRKGRRIGVFVIPARRDLVASAGVAMTSGRSETTVTMRDAWDSQIVGGYR